MSPRFRCVTALCLLLALVAGPLHAAPPSAQQVRQLLDTIGLGKSLAQTNAMVVSSMSHSLPCVSTDYWKGFLDADATNDYISRLVPIYQKHFTADEVSRLITFYSSPLGQKVLTEMPVALAEASQAGQQWSHQRGQQMLQKLEQSGQVTSAGRCPGMAPAEPMAAASSALPVASGAAPAQGGNVAGSASAAVAGAAAAAALHADEDADEHVPASTASSSHATHPRVHHHLTRAERLRREREEREERERKSSRSRHAVHGADTHHTRHAQSGAKKEEPATKKKSPRRHRTTPTKPAPVSSSSSGG